MSSVTSAFRNASGEKAEQIWSAIFGPTLDNYSKVLQQANYVQFIANSLWVAFAATALSLIIGDLNSYAQEQPIDIIKAGSDGTVGTADDYQFGLEELFENLDVIEGYRMGNPIPQFAYGSVTIEYWPQSAKGSQATVNSQTWNQVTNTDTATVPGTGITLAMACEELIGCAECAG